MSLNDTPRANRLHIGIYGKRNSGKSSLINTLTGQDTALVSPEAGTTTDPVYKSMELHPIGPVVFIDTAGFDDEGYVGAMRVERTAEVVGKTDLAIILIDKSSIDDLNYEKEWIKKFDEKGTPIIVVLNKCEKMTDPEISLSIEKLEKTLNVQDAVWISAEEGLNIDVLRMKIEKALPEDYMREKILGNLVCAEDLVLLVMPQDIQAPKGRLILPQVQTLRELLDRKCTAVATTADGLDAALKAMAKAPDLIITDSQCFNTVYEMKPEESRLTSFSVLFAAYKGDLDAFMEGASALDEMTEKSKVLIAEACTHVPLTEDIGRIKIPNLLRKKYGDKIEICNVCGKDFPGGKRLKEYDLIIHCGACMFNRRHVLSRIAEAEAAGVPITNYGIVLAKLNGILDKISFSH